MSKLSKDKVIRKLNSNLDLIFNDKSLTPQERGELGESVVEDLVRYWSSKFTNALVIPSYIYPQGPVLKSTNRVEENPVTEIDILVVTPYKIFSLEVKTLRNNVLIYEDSKMELSENGKFSGEYLGNNYLRQNEMHARHLYYQIHELLPNGDPSYIVPLIVMSGASKIEDRRSKHDKHHNPITITNKLVNALEHYSKPKDFLLDVKGIKKKLEKIQVFDKQRLLNSQQFKN